MQDTKNLCIAALSSTTSIFAAIEMQTLITIVSAVVLPVLFFCIGKTVDVLVQVRMQQMAQRRRERMRIDGEE